MTSAEAAAADPGLGEFFTVRKSWAWSEREGWFGDGRYSWPHFLYHFDSIGR